MFRNASWGADYSDPQDFLSLLWTTSSDLNARNQSGVSIPEVDRLCAQADAMTNQAARLSLYQQAEQLLVNQGAAIPYAQLVNTYVVRSRVANWHLAPMGMTPLSVWQDTYIKR